MTIIVDITNKEQLEREFEHIRTQFNDLTPSEGPLRIDWGLKSAFDSIEAHETAMTKFTDKAKIALRILALLEILDVPETSKVGMREAFFEMAFTHT